MGKLLGSTIITGPDPTNYRRLCRAKRWFMPMLGRAGAEDTAGP
jgi:hypothetical protein